MELCRKRPVIYSDLDYLKKGSTGFLHELGYSKENIALALDQGVREVENNLKGRDAGRPEWQCHPVHS